MFFFLPAPVSAAPARGNSVAPVAASAANKMSRPESVVALPSSTNRGRPRSVGPVSPGPASLARRRSKGPDAPMRRPRETAAPSSLFPDQRPSSFFSPPHAGRATDVPLAPGAAGLRAALDAESRAGGAALVDGGGGRGPSPEAGSSTSAAHMPGQMPLPQWTEEAVAPWGQLCRRRRSRTATGMEAGR